MVPPELPPGVRRLLRADGSVVVPPALAGEVLRILLRDLSARVQADGGELSAGVRGLLWNLHAAAVSAEEPPGGSGAGTLAGQPANVEVGTAEAARRMGCSESYVRRLARDGGVPARRLGAVWLIGLAPGAGLEERDAA